MNEDTFQPIQHLKFIMKYLLWSGLFLRMIAYCLTLVVTHLRLKKDI